MPKVRPNPGKPRPAHRVWVVYSANRMPTFVGMIAAAPSSSYAAQAMFSKMHLDAPHTFVVLDPKARFSAWEVARNEPRPA